MEPTRRLVRALLLLLLLIGAGHVTQAADALPTYAEWQTACARLPLNRTLGSRPPPKNLLPLPTFADFERVLDAYFALATNGPLARATNWAGTPPTPAFFNVERSWFAPPEIPFEPFAAKLVLPPDAKVFLQGDLHGDIHSLLAVLGRLQERKWLDGFTVTEPDLHLVFLGDLTDRGQYGVEVLYTLLRLRLANPDRVHLGRGNHEEVSLVARYGFLAEGRIKYGSGFKAARVLRAYDFFPVVLYLGCGTDFVQLCHGGMEPGFNPLDLLTAPGTNRFQLIGQLRQATFLRENPNWADGDAAARVEARRRFQDFTPVAPTSPSTLGFMWNDFTVFRDEPAFAYNPDRAFVYGEPAVRYLLAAAGRGETRLHAVIRAHQHSIMPNPMMRRLLAGRGVFRHWQETNSVAAQNAPAAELAARLDTAVSRPLPENSVWTLNVSPDSLYGAGCDYNFATFGLLQLGARFSDWRITVEPVKVPGL